MNDKLVLALLISNVVLAVINVVLAWPRTRLARKKLDKWEDR